MPLYEYKCENCEIQLEKLQKISEPSLVKCPECTKDSLVRLVSATKFRLKGGGWYETDFKGSGKRNLVNKSENESKTETKETTTGKKDEQ